MKPKFGAYASHDFAAQAAMEWVVLIRVARMQHPFRLAETEPREIGIAIHNVCAQHLPFKSHCDLDVAHQKIHG